MTTSAQAAAVHNLVLPWHRPPSLANDQRRRGHWSQQRRAKAEVTEAVAWLSRKHQLPRMGRVAVTIIWWPPDRRRRDADGMAPFLKAVLDGLTPPEGAVLEDDHAGVVPSVTMRIAEPQPPGRIELELTEIGEAAWPALTGE